MKAFFVRLNPYLILWVNIPLMVAMMFWSVWAVKDWATNLCSILVFGVIIWGHCRHYKKAVAAAAEAEEQK